MYRMNKLPNEIVNHPVADRFKESVDTVNEKLYRIIYRVYTSDTDTCCYADDMSFAEYFFWDRGLTKQYERAFDDWMNERSVMDDEYEDYGQEDQHEEDEE